MTEKYVLEVNTDHETGEEHCTVLKTDGTTNMANWTEIVSAMYTHHSILESLVDELNKIQNNYNNTEKYAIKLWKENEQLKASLYAEKTNTAEVVNDYSKQFKRHSAQFSFMMDLADDLGVDVATLEALDD